MAKTLLLANDIKSKDLGELLQLRKSLAAAISKVDVEIARKLAILLEEKK